jgi:hypothetical protein
VSRQEFGGSPQDVIGRIAFRKASYDLPHKRHVGTPIHEAALRRSGIPSEKVDYAGLGRYADVAAVKEGPDRQRSQIFRKADPRTTIGG